jgi:hypothetical protein
MIALWQLFDLKPKSHVGEGAEVHTRFGPLCKTEKEHRINNLTFKMMGGSRESPARLTFPPNV